MATVVTLVALVGLIAAITMGSEMLDVSRKQTIAMQILRNEVEQVHLRSWTTFPTSLPASFSVTVNDSGTDFSAGAAIDKMAFALANYSPSQASYNLRLMGQARGFSCTQTIVAVRPSLLQFTYTVSWTGGNRHKTYSRSSTTYYGKTGLNLYYQK